MAIKIRNKVFERRLRADQPGDNVAGYSVITLLSWSKRIRKHRVPRYHGRREEDSSPGRLCLNPSARRPLALFLFTRFIVPGPRHKISAEIQKY